MPDYGDAFDALAETENWYNVAVAGGAFLAAGIGKNIVESRGGTDLPDEAYGAGVIAGSAMFLSGDMRKYAVIGGGLHTAEAAARRVGIKSRLTSMGE